MRNIHLEWNMSSQSLIQMWLNCGYCSELHGIVFQLCSRALQIKDKNKDAENLSCIKTVLFLAAEGAPSFIIERIHFHVVYSITSGISVRSWQMKKRSLVFAVILRDHETKRQEMGLHTAEWHIEFYYPAVTINIQYSLWGQSAGIVS